MVKKKISATLGKGALLRTSQLQDAANVPHEDNKRDRAAAEQACESTSRRMYLLRIDAMWSSLARPFRSIVAKIARIPVAYASALLQGPE